MESLTLDPLIGRAHELLAKHLPTAQATLWLNPPALLGPPALSGWRFWQPNFPAHRDLIAAGWQELEDEQASRWDSVVLYASKHKEENWELLRAADGLLAPTGQMLFLVPNDYGSKSYQKSLQESGRLLGYESGRKSRLYRLRRGQGEAAPLFCPRQNRDGYWSAPGLFSWAAIDHGSLLLAQAMAGDPALGAAGTVADLGAGWGYLASRLAPRTAIALFESDRRALRCAEMNLSGRQVVRHWCDLSGGDPPAGLRPGLVDAVITNPPFHSGKREEAALGHRFALLAQQALPRGGVLWLVGNTHLAYARLLGHLFSQVETRAQAEGFTVLRAVK